MRRNGREILNLGIVESKIKIHFYTTLTENKSKSDASAHFIASQPADSCSTERTVSHAEPSLSSSSKQTSFLFLLIKSVLFVCSQHCSSQMSVLSVSLCKVF
jgi:hypothetical protein